MKNRQNSPLSKQVLHYCSNKYWDNSGGKKKACLLGGIFFHSALTEVFWNILTLYAHMSLFIGLVSQLTGNSWTGYSWVVKPN